MAYTETDLANVEAAIRAIIAGTRIASATIGDKTFSYTKADLPDLQKHCEEIATKVGLANGTFQPRSYARQGGRGI